MGEYFTIYDRNKFIEQKQFCSPDEILQPRRNFTDYTEGVFLYEAYDPQSFKQIRHIM